MERKNKPGRKPLSAQVKKHSEKKPEKKPEFDGNAETMISTGSTLLDLAISGRRIHGGGIPGGIMVEIFGPSGCGKTVLLSEIAGATQRQGGEIMFRDPEGRLNKQFAKLLDLDVDVIEYDTPDKVPQVFKSIREWEPKTKNHIHGIFADSLAALSTDLEMENEEGDKMGMRRAKEFSEECRKTCRILTQKNYLLVCSNQVRQSNETYGPKYKSPGGEAIGFYSSLRLRCNAPQKVKKKKTIKGKEVSRVVGVEVTVEVFKSSVWKPYREADVYILFDYGIDDVRANLQFMKKYGPKTKVQDDKGEEKDYTGYSLNGDKLGPGIDDAIAVIEEDGREQELKEAVIETWTELEEKFHTARKPKRRI